MPEHANVIEALSRVMADLPAIGRDQTASAQQGGYAYRGIEQITRHTQGLFAKHGVVFVPHVLSYEVRELTVNGKPWTDTLEMVSYTVYGPGGIDDHIEVGPILAIGRDNSDKGANKCMTQAYKYALLQALCISDAKDDGDAASHTADSHAEPALLHGWLTLDEQSNAHEDLRDAIGDESAGVQAAMRDFRKTNKFGWPMSCGEMQTMIDELDRLREVAGASSPAELDSGGEVPIAAGDPPHPVERSKIAEEMVSKDAQAVVDRAAALAARARDDEPTDLKLTSAGGA